MSMALFVKKTSCYQSLSYGYLVPVQTCTGDGVNEINSGVRQSENLNFIAGKYLTVLLGICTLIHTVLVRNYEVFHETVN